MIFRQGFGRNHLQQRFKVTLALELAFLFVFFGFKGDFAGRLVLTDPNLTGIHMKRFGQEHGIAVSSGKDFGSFIHGEARRMYSCDQVTTL